MPLTDSLPQVSRPAPRRPLALSATAVAAGVLFLLRRRRRDQEHRPTRQDPSAPVSRTDPGTGADGGERLWSCECGQEYRVQGVDRHRVYWLAGADASDPVLAAECPSCGRVLPREHEHPESVPG